MNKPTNAYWQRRFIRLTEALLNKGEEHNQDLVVEYEKAMLSIQKDIGIFYQRFANNNEISLVDAKKLLSARELQEFQWTVKEYIQKGRENSIDQRWIKELENASTRIRLSRLDALQYQIRQQIELVTAKRLLGMGKLASEIVEDGYYKSIYELQKGFGIGDTFNILDTRLIENIISKPWAPDGSNFSDKIWRDRQLLVNELQKELAQSFIRGDAPDEAIRNIARTMDTSRKAAGRLVMTESAFFANEARAKAFEELGVDEYQFLATLDMRTSEICQDMDLRVFKLSEREIGVNWPPLHPWCRSTIVPHFEGNIKTRFARDPKTDKGYYVDGDMAYKDWYNKYIKPSTLPTGVGKWEKDENGVVIPTAIISGRYSPSLKGEPNSVVQNTNKSGQINRNFYDSNGFLTKQIHNGPHNNIKQHPFGKEGEHAHYWQYENGKVVSREPVNIKEDDINSNIDILGWLR